MENEGLESVPPVMLLRFCLEEKLSALRENRPILEAVVSFLSMSERWLSGLLEMLHNRLLDEHIDNFIQKAELTPIEREVSQLRRQYPELTAKQIGERLGRAEGTIRAAYYLSLRKCRRIHSPFDEAIDENIANDVKTLNVFAQECFRQLQQEPPQLLAPRGFAEKRKQAYEVEKVLVSKKASFEAAFAMMIENPIISLFDELSFVVWSHRLHLRYLRSRFGMKGTASRRLALKQTRTAESKHTFQSWRRRNRKSGFSESEIQADYRAWKKELLYEQLLFEYAKERLIEAQTLQTIWQNAIYLSFTSLCDKHGDINFDLKEFATDVLTGMKRNIKEFRLVYDTTKLDLKREFSYDYENELARISGWAEANLSPDHNPRLAKAIEIEGQRTVSEWIPGSVLLSLAGDDREENESFYSGTGKPSLLSRIARHLEEKKEEPLNNADVLAEDFALREEARITEQKADEIDFERYVSKLTPHEQQFILNIGLTQEQMEAVRQLPARQRAVTELRLQGYKERDIARQLNISVGTVRVHDQRAKRRLAKSRTGF